MSGEPGLKNKWQMKSRQQNWETMANFLLWERSGENPIVPLLATGIHGQHWATSANKSPPARHKQ